MIHLDEVRPIYKNGGPKKQLFKNNRQYAPVIIENKNYVPYDYIPKSKLLNLYRNNNNNATIEELMDYIGLIENENHVGYDEKTDTWGRPQGKGYDKYNVGYGIDRNTNPYLTTEERNINTRITNDRERYLRLKSIQGLDGFYKNRYKEGLEMYKNANPISPYKQKLMYQALYKNPSDVRKNFKTILAKPFMTGSDKEFEDAIIKMQTIAQPKTSPNRNRLIIKNSEIIN